MRALSTPPPTSLPTYLQHFAPLIGDRRTATTFQEIIQGILTAGSLVCARIAATSPRLAPAKDPAQRVIRFATGEATTRSHLDAPHLVTQLADRALDRLAQTPPAHDIWVIMDGSDLRKPQQPRPA